MLNQINQLKQGPITAKKLKKKGIVSPSTAKAIKIGRGTYCVPKVNFRSEASKQKWIEHKRKQLNLI